MAVDKMIELSYVYRIGPSGRTYKGESLYWYIRIIQDTDERYTYMIEESTDLCVKDDTHWDRFKLANYWREKTGCYPNSICFMQLTDAEQFIQKAANKFGFTKVLI